MKPTYYTSKRGEVEITLEQLMKAGHQKSHGRTVWQDMGDGTRREMLCHFRTGSIVDLDGFRVLEKEAAEMRRATYKGGRKVQRGRSTHSFALQYASAFGR